MNEKTCLLIDDDADDREFFGMAIQTLDRNINCAYAFDGDDALQQLRNPNFVPDIIFLDLNMPRKNGWECLVLLKQFQHLEEVPVIIYTTSSDGLESLKADKLGATDFLVKPHSMKKLIEQLGSVLSRYHISS